MDLPLVVTLIAKLIVVAVGVVENVNVEPPLIVISVDDNPMLVTGKSDATPVVAPPALETVIVHEADEPILNGDEIKHAIEDTDDGVPYTARLMALFAIPMLPMLATIAKAVVVMADVAEKVKELPPVDVAKAVVVLEDEVRKSVETPVVAPRVLDTDIVQIIGNVALNGVTQDRDEAVVGVPYTAKLTEPNLINDAPTFTAIVKVLVVTEGVVENVNVDPPLSVVTAVVVNVEETV
jgi:hypothetical protein